MNHEQIVSSTDAGRVEPVALVPTSNPLRRKSRQIEALVKAHARAQVLTDPELASLKALEKRVRKSLHVARLRITKKGQKIRKLESGLELARTALDNARATAATAEVDLVTLQEQRQSRCRVISANALRELFPEAFTQADAVDHPDR